jgi:hypothetical protein
MSFHSWLSLWEETEHGEIVALDVHRVARAIEAVATARGLYLRFKDDELYKELTHFVWLRLNGREVRARRNQWQAEWDARKEAVWVEWIQQYAVPHDVWITAIFQKDPSLWEEHCVGWRDDLEAMFPSWVVRDPVRLAEIDPTPFELTSYADEIRAAIDASDANLQRRLK